MKVRYAVLLALLVPVAASAQVAEGVATGAALDELERRADAILAEATEAGDYLATKAAIEALNVLRQAELAYGRQLDRTVAETEGLLRRLNDVDAMLDDAQAKLDGQLVEVGNLETRIAQIGSDVLPGQAGPYVSRVTPMIVRPTASPNQRFTVTGVDLREVHLTSRTSGTAINVKPINNQSYLVEIPASEFQHGSQIGVQTFPMTLVGKRKFLVGPKKVKETELTVGVLPAELGTYAYKGTYTEMVREERRVEKSPGQMRGSNTTKHKWARPTEGWLIDIEQPITVRQSGSNNGRCEGHVANDLSANGVKLQARLDRIGPSMQYPSGADGKVSCHATFTEYRMVPSKKEFSGTGKLKWSSDSLVELPDRLADATFQLNLFDGSIYSATGSRKEKYFELKRDGQQVLLKPTPPSTL